MERQNLPRCQTVYETGTVINGGERKGHMTLGKKAKLVYFTSLDGSQQSMHQKQPHFLKKINLIPHMEPKHHTVCLCHIYQA